MTRRTKIDANHKETAYRTITTTVRPVTPADLRREYLRKLTATQVHDRIKEHD